MPKPLRKSMGAASCALPIFRKIIFSAPAPRCLKRLPVQSARLKRRTDTTMANPISRRRQISICAAACGLPLLGLASTSHAGVEPVIWKGQALGAPATLILNHPDRNKAQQLIQRVVLEVQRLEAIFSLYRKDSALNELNRFGALAMPPEELVAV